MRLELSGVLDIPVSDTLCGALLTLSPRSSRLGNGVFQTRSDTVE